MPRRAWLCLHTQWEFAAKLMAVPPDTMGACCQVNGGVSHTPVLRTPEEFDAKSMAVPHTQGEFAAKLMAVPPDTVGVCCQVNGGASRHRGSFAAKLMAVPPDTQGECQLNGGASMHLSARRAN